MEELSFDAPFSISVVPNPGANTTVRVNSQNGIANPLYGIVDTQFVGRLRQAVQDHSRVVWFAEGGEGAQEVESRASDSSRHAPHRPDVVVLPISTKEVSEVVQLCSEKNIPITPRGAGSGLEGGAIPIQGGVVIDTMRLKDIDLSFKDDMVAVVGAGVLKGELNAALEPHGLMFGPDPASNPTLGGMASTGGSGMSTPACGTTKENIVSLTVVLPDGRIVSTRQQVRKSATGYDLTQLFAGAEGTLGIITRLAVRVRSRPKVRCGALVRFDNVEQAAATVVNVVSTGLPSLARCELMNADGIVATNKRYETSLSAQPTLFVEFWANSTLAIQADADRLKQIAEGNKCTKFQFEQDGGKLDDLWAARRGCYLASFTYRGQRDLVYISDVCVPISKLARCVAETEADFTKAGHPCIICAHIADGNFHCCIPYKTDEEFELVKSLEKNMIHRALQMGGTVSGEHGVGFGKIDKILLEHGEVHIDTMRMIKRALDPKNIMNPGKLFSWGRAACCVHKL